MAGSKRWFTYVTDAGESFGLNADESNTERVNPAGDVVPPASSLEYSIPKNVKPRYATYRSNDGKTTIRAYLLTAAAYSNVKTRVPSIPNPFNTSETLSYKSKKNEEIKPTVIALDTGLTDSDQEGAAAPNP